jgi:choline kinase
VSDSPNENRIQSLRCAATEVRGATVAAATHVTAPFLLTMCDHLFEQSIVDLLLREAQPDRLNLAIDKKARFHFRLERRDESPDAR